jgi:hypothetical protein
MKRLWCIAALLLFIGISGVVSTYAHLSQTVDEPWHIYCGLQWWHNKTVGTVDGVSGNPPLAHAMSTAPLYIANNFIAPPRGISLRDYYMRETVLTRLGILPFYILSCLVVFIWSRQLFGMASALWSLGLYISLPIVTGHAGLATTDMAYTAMLLLALMAGMRWLERPSAVNAILMGESVGLMIGTKFSALVQWPAAMLVIVVAQAVINRRQSLPAFPFRRAHIITGLVYVLPLSVLMLGLLYRFNFGTLFADLHAAKLIEEHGFHIWLFGPLHEAVWYFFPVVFFFKTPLPFHFASLLGGWKTIRSVKQGEDMKRLFPLLAAGIIMLVSMTSNVNLGVRHVLPLYPLLAIPAGYGLRLLWEGIMWRRALACGLVLWQVAGFASAYPDHIAYFNELAGPHPEFISLDSDFDWAEDEMQLAEALRKHNVDAVYLCLRPQHVNDKSKVLLDATVLSCPDDAVTGWIAIGRTERMTHPHKFAWLSQYEAVQKVGKILDLYYIPER